MNVEEGTHPRRNTPPTSNAWCARSYREGRPMTKGYLGTGRRRAAGGILCTSLVALASLLASTAEALAQSKSDNSRAAATAGPAQFSTPQNSPGPGEKGVAADDVWREMPVRLRGNTPSGELLFDNGAPIDDFGNPASQWSEALPPWKFIAAAADDFSIPDALSPNTVARISTVRVAFHFFQSGAPSATPTTTWTGGVYVTIYENAVGNIPSGQPNEMGGHTGTVVASQLVPMAELENQTLVNSCRPAYVVDIPVDLLVAKNRTYWISVVPRHHAPPQSAWMLSTDLPFDVSMSKVFFPFVGINSWSNNPGNLGFCVAQGTPAAGEARELSFQLYGQKTVTDVGACCNTQTGMCTTVSSVTQCAGPFDVFHIGTICSLLNPPCAPVIGACCNDSTGMCMDNVGIADCQDLDERFEPDTLCANLVPPCGDTTPGACCKPDGTCEDLPILDCENMNGAWIAGTCAAVQCPPVNDSCQFKLTITSGLSPFSTLGATTDGPPDAGPGCPVITHDIWYSYTAECTGTLHISLCDGTNFNSALAVYDSCFCPPVLGPRLACNNDGCMTPGGPSKVSLPVTMGNCYLIRIGGVAGATGSGNLKIDCVPTGQGACCHADHTCEVLPAAACIAPDVFTPGEPCSPITCPPPENDPCAGALTLGEGVTPFVTNGASSDGPADTPNPPCSLITRDVWYNYVATCDGEVTIDLCGASFNAAMAVYEGCACPVGAAPIACDNDACQPNGAPTVTFPVTSGNCYLVRIGGVMGATGTGNITVTCDPFGACCFLDGHCEELVEADCIAATGTFSGPATSCTPNNCPPPIGACCFADGHCKAQTEADCTAAMGVFGGPGTTCTPNPCPQPIGACCYPNGSCQEQTEIACNGNGGTFQGPGTGCDPNPCVQPAGACCLPDGSCQILDSLACASANGDFQGSGVLCQDVTCPQPCCPGDLQGDGDLDLIDLDPLISAVLNPPLPAAPEFCRADVNGDNAVNGQDLVAFTALILPGYATCPPASVPCCPGDCNSDGTIDGLDINEFIIRLLANPPLGSLELCVADVNEDEMLDLADADVLVNKLLIGDTCP